jgi:predicted ester cyclase
MSTEDNKALVRRYQDAYNTNNLDALDDILSPEIATPAMLPGFPPGIEGIKQVHRATLAAWPDAHAEIEDLIAEGDQVAARITLTGAAVNPGFGLPGTGNRFRVGGMYIVRIANGKIVEHTGWEDVMSLMQQIQGTPGG